MVQERVPGCWLYQFPFFATNSVPPASVGRKTDVFPFPSLGGESQGVMGAGDIIGVFSDRPEVREVVRYMLGPGYGSRAHGADAVHLVRTAGSTCRKYEPFERRQAELIQAALAADAFRFDASDLMPPPVGAPEAEGDIGRFWAAMMRYATEGPDSLDAILAELDAAWPDDG